MSFACTSWSGELKRTDQAAVSLTDWFIMSDVIERDQFEKVIGLQSQPIRQPYEQHLSHSGNEAPLYLIASICKIPGFQFVKYSKLIF